MRNINEVLNDITPLNHEIQQYVITTPHWMFYWIDNEKIYTYILKNIDDYEKTMELNIVACGTMFYGEVYLFNERIGKDYSDFVNVSGSLLNFRQSVEDNWKEWKNRLIEDKTKDLLFYKEKIAHIEKQLNKLKGQPNE